MNNVSVAVQPANQSAQKKWNEEGKKKLIEFCVRVSYISCTCLYLCLHYYTHAHTHTHAQRHKLKREREKTIDISMFEWQLVYVSCEQWTWTMQSIFFSNVVDMHIVGSYGTALNANTQQTNTLCLNGIY